MENSFFVYTKKPSVLIIERFHVCTWEFKNDSSLIELGFEISKESISGDNISITIFLPWLTKESSIKDLYPSLSKAKNSRFIFNDSVINTQHLDGGDGKLGVIHKFSEREELSILPVTFEINENNKTVTINISLISHNSNTAIKPNVYFRVLIDPKIPHLSMRKNGISKSTIIFDIKVNERRNLPEILVTEVNNISLCKIKSCFCLNIIPNSYDLSFLETEHLRKVRNLEYTSFKEYLDDNRVVENEHLVVVHKKDNLESYSFFSIFTKERIGSGQFVLALLINLVCGILLFIPSYRKSFLTAIPKSDILFNMPKEFYLAIVIVGIAILYFLWPRVCLLKTKVISFFSNRPQSSKK